MKDSIPASYAEWRRCITEDCGIELTPGYIAKRISALKNDNDPHTKQFVKLYGQQYREQVINWFMQAQS